MRMVEYDRVIRNSDKSVFYQYFSCATAQLSIVTCGVYYGWPSPSLPKLLAPNSPIPITENEGFWLATIPMIGALVGSLITPFLIDRIGRKKTILLTSIPHMIGWILIIFAATAPMLCIARFVAGISDGLSFSSVPIYSGEVSDPKRRGMFGSWSGISFVLGILIVNIVGSYTTIKQTALILGGIPIVMNLSFVWMPESPYFFIMKDNRKAARKSFEKFRGPTAADSELIGIEKAVKSDLTKTWTNPLHLFTVKRNRKAVIVMLLTRGIQQLSGNSAISFYTQNIFEEAGSAITAELASIIFFSTQLIVAIIASGIVDKYGRKPLLIISIAGSGLCLLIQGVYFYIRTNTALDIRYFSFIPLVALLSYITFFSVGLQIIPLITLSEVFNQDIKATALCFADVYFAVLVVVTSKFFQFTRDTFGMFVPILTFSGICGLSLMLVVRIFPETKGKTLEEIQEYFKGGKNGKSTQRVDEFLLPKMMLPVNDVGINKHYEV